MMARLGGLMFNQFRPPPPPDERCSPAMKIAQSGAIAQLQALAQEGRLPRLAACGFRVFSQFEEDGYLLYLAAVFDLPKLFVDIGASDGINSNCANLALNLDWHGLFIEGNPAKVARGEQFYAAHPDTWLYPPLFKQAMVTRENINQLIEGSRIRGRIGIVSIDIDGNDYWIWDAVNVVQPAIVIIETRVEFGMRNIVVPYDANYAYPGKHPDYFGASPVAMTRLARRKGYRLVGANRFGFNLIFARNDLPESCVPEVPLESVLQHPRFAERLSLFNETSGFAYVTPDP